MQYGYFDNINKEYVITRPDTPTPWINYLGQAGGFAGIISNMAGGTAYHKDPQHLRVLRQRINSLPDDRPGRYIYVKDMETGEVFSPMWQPVMTELGDYECRHGMGYTVITGSKNNVSASVRYFVPLKEDHEIWTLKLLNKGDKKRKFRIFSYAEFCHWEAISDMLYSWTLMSNKYSCENAVIAGAPMVLAPKDPMITFMSTNAEIHSYDCDLKAFIGPYRSESNPLAVENGQCGNSDILSDSACAVFCVEVELQAGEEKRWDYILGTAADRQAAELRCQTALSSTLIDKQFNELAEYWTDFMSYLQVETPDQEVNDILNVWNQYQCKTTFDWSRFISTYERGMDRGIGYRDTMQDTLGIMHALPELALEKIKLLLSLQKQNGNPLDVYFPGTGEAKGGDRSDDHLWGVIAIEKYLKETGKVNVLNDMVPWYDGGEATVLEHLERGIEFSMNNLGEHGITLLMLSDWNDSLRPINAINGQAESVMVFWQLGNAVTSLIEMFEYLQDQEKVEKYQALKDDLKNRVNQLWDGNWFIRAFDGLNNPVGSHKDEFNKIYLNAQSWAVLSDLVDEDKLIKAMDSVRKHLRTKYGLQLIWPPAPFFDLEKKACIPMPAGSRENGGVFFHSNPWAIIAETKLGRSEYAYEYYNTILPSKRNEDAEITGTEPYVYTQNMLGAQHERHGRCYNSWLSGTSAWCFTAGSQYILGIRPEYDGLLIDPAIPQEWDSYKANRKYRGTMFNIEVENTGKGKKQPVVFLNGQQLESNLIPASLVQGQDQVNVKVLLQ